MATKPKKAGRYPGPGYDEQGPGVPVPPKKKASTKYSPAPMSAAAKAKASARGNMQTKSAFTPAQKAELKKMLSQSGRLDK